MKSKLPQPVFQRITGPRERYVLHETYRILLPIVRRELTILSMFTWDGGSVPRAFWWIVHPQELPACFIVHDALYAAELVTREQADDILFELAILDGASWAQRQVIWASVRACGGSVWRGHTKDSIRHARHYCSLSP